MNPGTENDFIIKIKLPENSNEAITDDFSKSKEMQRDSIPCCLSKTRNFIRPILFLISITYIFLYTGSIYGWGPMQLLLEDAGHFSSQCKSFEELPCNKQSSMLLNVQFIADFVQVLSPAVGAGVDKFGPSTMITWAFITGTLGLSMLTFATIFGVDWLLFPSFISIGFMSTITCIFPLQTGMLFPPGRTRDRVISCLNSMLDAGSMTYLFLWYIGEHWHIPLKTISATYLYIFIVVMGIVVICWDESESQNTNLQIESRPRVPNENDTAKTDSSAYILIAQRPPKNQLLSSQFITIFLVCSFHDSHHIWCATTAKEFLESLGDDEVGNLYLTLFTLMTPLSLLGLPFVDFILYKYGYGVGFHIINILGIALAIVRLASTSLNVQVAGFVIFSFYSCFIFNITLASLPTFMSNAVLGQACGWAFLGGTVLSTVVNIPLNNITLNKLNGNFFVSNLMYLVGCVLSVYLCERIRVGFAKENALKKKLENNDEVDNGSVDTGSISSYTSSMTKRTRWTRVWFV